MGVYFLQIGKRGKIKIGSATDVLKRMAALQCGHPEPIRLLAVMAGDNSDERAIQKRFVKHRVRGEWFRPVKALLDFISTLPDAPLSRQEQRTKQIIESGAMTLWFDPSIPTDFDVEKLTGITRGSLRLRLGPSGRDARKMDRQEARRRGKLGGHPPKDKPMTDAAFMRIWRKRLPSARRAELAGVSVRAAFRWADKIKRERQNSGEQ